MEDQDCIFIQNLSQTLKILNNGLGSIPEDVPVLISLIIYTDILDQVGDKDDLQPGSSIDYAKVTQEIIRVGSDQGPFRTLSEFTRKVQEVLRTLLGSQIKGLKLNVVEGERDQSSSHVQTKYGASAIMGPNLPGGEIWTTSLTDFQISLVIGVYPEEWTQPQDILVSLKLERGVFDRQRLESFVTETVQNSRTCKTLEAFARVLAEATFEDLWSPKVQITLKKPGALKYADWPGITITRDQRWWWRNNKDNQDKPHIAYIALGSNSGNRIQNIHKGLSLAVKKSVFKKILDTSFMYESPPMYFEAQEKFLNAVVKVSTELQPHELLVKLKKIEREVGRVETFKNGPRALDLDILLYDDLILHSGELIIPHPGIQERRFVLVPLLDIHKNGKHPLSGRTFTDLLSDLPPLTPATEIHKVLCFTGPNEDEVTWTWGSKSILMGIINTTPDSFSCGGANYDLEDGLRASLKAQTDGAHILDLGGVSTRKDAEDVEEAEELRRVIPLLQALRGQEGFNLPISIDTFRAKVAEAALDSGANFINDVSGGSKDPEMFQVMAQAQCPVILMHMRGTPKTMALPETRIYENRDVLDGIQKELGDLVRKGIQRGLYRWNIIVDPGIGFAKDAEQNLQIIRGLKGLVGVEGRALYGFPLLMGVSRKSFIGTLSGVMEPSERVMGTGGAVAICIAHGADILRVHDVPEMAELIKVVDGILRG